MKVLEAQSAVLSNFEVQQHLLEVSKRQQNIMAERKRNRQGSRRRDDDDDTAPNKKLWTVTQEILEWFQKPINPLSKENKQKPYTQESIAKLLEKLRPYDLSKGEVIMLLNIRPRLPAALNSVVEHMYDRLTEDQQQELLKIVAEVLGEFNPPQPRADEPAGDQNGNDVTMGEDE